MRYTIIGLKTGIIRRLEARGRLKRNIIRHGRHSTRLIATYSHSSLEHKASFYFYARKIEGYLKTLPPLPFSQNKNHSQKGWSSVVKPPISHTQSLSLSLDSIVRKELSLKNRILKKVFAKKQSLFLEIKNYAG